MEAIRNELPELSQASFFNNSKNQEADKIEGNRKYLFQEKDGNVILDPGISFASFFATQEDFQSLELSKFKALIAHLLNYVEDLKILGNNWISGDSISPGELSLDLAKDILHYLDAEYTSKPVYLSSYTPGIIMGPIPAGGVSIEVSPQADVRLYINIYNPGNIEMELDNQGFFTEIGATKDNFKAKMAELLSEYGAWYNYSGWGNIIQVC